MEGYDSLGIYGMYAHYAGIIFFVGTAAIMFSYLWYKGKLDMDEEPKIQMLEERE
ncbi:hypothetical protein BN1013_00342 [Candidatus Rubidus massiliensis]|nr:hypothetical protein BN1013_00342 [Candidatus Rubidus massiliensis]